MPRISTRVLTPQLAQEVAEAQRKEELAMRQASGLLPAVEEPANLVERKPDIDMIISNLNDFH